MPRPRATSTSAASTGVRRRHQSIHGPPDRPTDRPGPVRRPQISRPTPGREITRSASHPSHRRPSRRLRGTHRRRYARPLNRSPWKFQRNDNGDGRPGARDRCHAVVDVRTPCPLISITISTSTGTNSVAALRWTGVQSGRCPSVRARYTAYSHRAVVVKRPLARPITSRPCLVSLAGERKYRLLMH